MRTRADGSDLDPRSSASVLEAVLSELGVRWYSEHLIKQERSVLLRFFDHLKEKRIHDVRAVTEADVVEYARLLKEKRTAKGEPYSVATIRTYLSAIQRLFRFLLQRDVILQDPSLNLVLPSRKRLPRVVLNQAHARRLVANPDPFTVRASATGPCSSCSTARPSGSASARGWTSAT